MPQSYAPGQEGQVDWYGAELRGAPVKLPVFSLRSMVSGAAFHRVYQPRRSQRFSSPVEVGIRTRDASRAEYQVGLRNVAIYNLEMDTGRDGGGWRRRLWRHGTYKDTHGQIRIAPKIDIRISSKE